MRKFPARPEWTDQEKKYHQDAVHGEELVISVRFHQIAAGVASSSRISTRRYRESEEEGHSHQIQKTDPLVIVRQEPALDPCVALM